MKVLFCFICILATLAFISIFNLANAETCDAGHGCRITCRDGCGAIYWEETGRCSKFCVKPSKIQSKQDRINATFQDLPKNRVSEILKSLEK